MSNNYQVCAVCSCSQWFIWLIAFFLGSTWKPTGTITTMASIGEVWFRESWAFNSRFPDSNPGNQTRLDYRLASFWTRHAYMMITDEVSQVCVWRHCGVRAGQFSKTIWRACHQQAPDPLITAPQLHPLFSARMAMSTIEHQPSCPNDL